MTQKQLKDNFCYHEDGELIRTRSKSGGNTGQPIGYFRRGRKFFILNGKEYQLSRAIFLFHHGYLPKLVDHKDTNPLNNRIENLRPAKKCENCQNTKKARSSNGFKGVTMKRGRWTASIRKHPKRYYLGMFDTPEEAALAYNRAALEHHGEFAQLNTTA